SDGNGSHASTLKSPSYTKSVSWQHYRSSCCWPDDGDHRSVEITEQGAEFRALFNDTVSLHKIKYCYILLANSLLT
ncbi:hypothetical protein, partial [Escherichia coli]|uniref:hypothetical protein n=1 Tax=Escherichia coli TaxID=562 RepID=UPI00327B39C9